MTFENFFRSATGNKPYAYQARLAGGDSGSACASLLINIPTGLGKTAAVVLAWLWNRVAHPDASHRDTWPRRLVICLPMRTLVEQTHAEAAKWLDAHKLRWDEKSDASHTGKVGLHLLMGGADSGEWDIHPEANAILIGTQDMLLSRALNRGYGSARARWPMHFGLLNNDCLWVLDETQLMGIGVRTSAQLEGLRRRIGTALGCATWWASATLDDRLLITPDHPALPGTLALDETDFKNIEVNRRIHSVKRLAPLPLILAGDSAKFVDPYIDQLALVVLERHQTGTTTIVILNRVDRAKDLHAAFDKLARKQTLPPRLLVHSRFRPMERDPLSQAIKQPGEKIIVATQAIEAGVDISARTLITELAPWSSLVQRFGRCNRKGEFNDTGGADILWINLETSDEKAAADLALPYTPEQLAAARTLLRQAEPAGASPAVLEKLHAEEPLPETHLLRRKDLVDLFDTTPDLSGLDIDVGRYIRDGDERDVQVFWRDLPAKPGASDLDPIEPQRRELVRVAVHAFRKFYDKNKSSGIWRWNVLDGEWQALRPDRISPGQVYLIDSSLGGYSSALGWTGEKSKETFSVLTHADQATRAAPRDGQGTDDESQRRSAPDPFQTIEQHTTHVVAATRELLACFPSAQPWSDALITAARWHDLGKAHPTFQRFLTEGRDIPETHRSSYLAKSTWRAGVSFDRPHFRHELASALAWLQAGDSGDATFDNLVAYLIATHHGKVRLSLRAMPGEAAPPSDEFGQTPLFARGVWQNDRLPSDPAKTLNLEGVPASPHAFPLKLELSCMQLGEQDGRPSWTARMLSLRDSETLGLFRLAWLESLLRSADAEGSKR